MEFKAFKHGVISFCSRGCPNCHEAAAAGGSPGGVMDWGFPSNLPESRLLRLLLLLLILVMAGAWLFAFVQWCVYNISIRTIVRSISDISLVSFSHSIIFTVYGAGYYSRLWLVLCHLLCALL
jgi:hypothetical protein